MVRILCTDISSVTWERYRQLYQAASPQRQARADRCRQFHDALCCITAEVLLRQALVDRFGGWEDFSIVRTELGKPCLEGRQDFHFSISHSGSWVALAWGEQELGLDIQTVDEKRSTPAFARRFFTEEEQAWLAVQTHYPLAFTKIWTAKESYLKKLGAGLTKSLTSFSVFSPEENIRFHWETIGCNCLCLCAEDPDYRLDIIDIKNAPA